MHQSTLRTSFMFTMAVVVFSTQGPPVLADDISGSDRILCAALQATRCRADSDCQIGSPRRWNIPDFIEIDFIKKRLQTTEASGVDRVTPITTLVRAEGQAFIQGIDRQRAFSLVIDERSGNLTAAMASDGTAVTAFAVCTPLQEVDDK